MWTIRFLLIFALISVTTVAAQAAPVTFFGEDLNPAGTVPADTLHKLGLGGMQILSDEEGRQIRGQSGNAFARGISTVTTVVLDRATGSFIIGFNGTSVRATDENGGNVSSQATTTHRSAAGGSLRITTPNSAFTGRIFGGSGGSAHASSN